MQVVRPFGDDVPLMNLGSSGGHSCGIARDGRGIVYCWGNNSNGELGDGTTMSRNLPTPVVTPRGG